MDKFATMGKEELRAACRAASISYSKLNNDGMRDALRAAETNVTEAEAAAGAAFLEGCEEAPVEQLGGYSAFSMLGGAPAPKVEAPATVVRDGKKVDPNTPEPKDEDEDKSFHYDGSCPLCGAHHSSQTWANEGVSCTCHECGKTYSVSTGREVRAGYTRENVNKGYKIQKVRPEQNGVKRPSEGTLCGNVWAALDKLREEKGMAVATDLQGLADANGWNRNNVMCEFYQWRKFNGISGRQTRTEPADSK